MLKRISPIVPVANLEKSIDFFCNKLGFGIETESEYYARIYRDQVQISLVKAAPEIDTHDPNRQLSCYVEVEGIDDLYEELRSGLETLPEGRVKAPFNQAYGQREFHVIDEDSLLIFFGEPLQAS